MNEPSQNCRYVDDLVCEFLRYIPKEKQPEFLQMTDFIKQRFTLMREWGRNRTHKINKH